METKRFIELIEQNTEYKARSYSGRYMYGEECVGFSCDSVGMFMLDMDDVLEQGSFKTGEKTEFKKALKNYRSDQLGRRMIIYFKDIKWENSNG